MNHEYNILEKKIIKGESLTSLVTDSNIFMALQVKAQNFNNDTIDKVIEQLDRKSCKASVANRIQAIVKIFGEHNLESYIYTTEKTSICKFIREDSLLTDWVIAHNITRLGLETFVRLMLDTNHDESNLFNYLVKNYSDLLDWHLENIEIYHNVNSNNQIIKSTHYLMLYPNKVDNYMLSILNRYEDYLSEQ